MDERVGYLGLGAMGAGMARNLLRKDVDLTVYDINNDAVVPFEALGAKVATSPAELAASVDFVISSLPGSKEVRSVYLDRGGVSEGIQPGALIVEMSTVPPAVTQDLAKQFAYKNVTVMDAPVARTKRAAEEGTLAIMVGGTGSDYQRALPLLELMGTSISHLGPVGTGDLAKLVNNAVLMANILAVSEGLALGSKLGADVTSLAQVLTEGSADSFALRNHVQGSVLRGTFDEGRFPLSYAIKDIEYFIESADSVSLIAPQLRQMATFYKSAFESGLNQEYFPIVVSILDKLNNTNIIGFSA